MKPPRNSRRAPVLYNEAVKKVHSSCINRVPKLSENEVKSPGLPWESPIAEGGTGCVKRLVNKRDFVSSIIRSI